eukprot:9937794-Prorocentrum_lima.AAC.1
MVGWVEKAWKGARGGRRRLFFRASLRENVTAVGAVAGHERRCACGGSTGSAGAGAGVAQKQDAGR